MRVGNTLSIEGRRTVVGKPQPLGLDGGKTVYPVERSLTVNRPFPESSLIRYPT